jgi:hypothetical protein
LYFGAGPVVKEMVIFLRAGAAGGFKPLFIDFNSHLCYINDGHSGSPAFSTDLAKYSAAYRQEWC